MKKIYLLLTVGTLFCGCENSSTMKPDEVGASLFEIFQTNAIENLKSLCLSVNESLEAFDRLEHKVELDEEQKKKMDRLRNNEEYREKIDSKSYQLITESFVLARENLLKELKTDIRTYNISEVYSQMEKIQGQNSGKIILEIENDTNDKKYIGFKLTEVSHDTWKLYGGIWIPRAVSKGYVKYR